MPSSTTINRPGRRGKQSAAAAHVSYQAMRDLFEGSGEDCGRGAPAWALLLRPVQAGDRPRAGVRAGRASPQQHLGPRTREQVYQDKENERVRVQATEARRSMRRYLLEGADGEQLAA